MQELHRVLTARHGNKPDGHWSVMKATFLGVKQMATTHAWSQRGASCFVSTCVSTNTHEGKHLTNFEDDWGNVTYEEIYRPSIFHHLYECLSTIDEHNREIQNMIAL